jgi:hypothetical protein
MLWYTSLYLGIILFTLVILLLYFKDEHIAETFHGRYDSITERRVMSETPDYIYMSSLENDEFERLRVKEQMRVLPDYVDQFTS